MKRYIITIIVWVIAAITINAGISFDYQQNGYYLSYYIPVDEPITFYLRLDNDAGWPIAVINNGFRVYSPDGAVWQPITFDTVSIGWNQMLDDVGLSYFSVNGTGADTVGFSGQSFGSGIPIGFDSVAFLITTQVDTSQIGKTLCLDSAFFPPTGYWLWEDADTGSVIPSWNGPFCFEVSDCFTGCGDVDGDGDAGIDDLTYFVDYIFGLSGTGPGPPPPCIHNAEVDGCNGINAGDLDYLRQYMFAIPGPELCPEEPNFDVTSTGSISLDHIDGPYVTGTDLIVADGVTPITFYLRVTGDYSNRGAITNGFQIYSPDGAQWGGLVGDTVYPPGDLFDIAFVINYFNVSGAGADTVGFGGFRLSSSGLPAFFDEQFYAITIGPFDPSEAGKTIVLDSCFFPPACEWGFYNNYYLPPAHPSWDGPHIFTLVESCCVPPTRGNIDYSPDNEINIADLVYFVDWSFNEPSGPAPPCPEEADVDGSGSIDIEDIVYMVEWMFNDGPPPVACS